MWFIHGMYALMLVVGTLVATAFASYPLRGGDERSNLGEDSWRRIFLVTIAISSVNLGLVIMGFSDSLWHSGPRADNPSRVEEQPVRGASGLGQQQQEETQTTGSAMRDVGDMSKVKDV